jgi:uridylate kinase
MAEGFAGRPVYKRALLKLSGESLKGQVAYGLGSEAVRYAAEQIKEGVDLGVEMGVVVGGGNIWRGQEAEARGMDRATADYAGMLATMINALALQDSLEKLGLDTRTQTAIEVQAVAEPYIRRRAIRHLEKGRVVLFAAGTGNPYMTTDTAAALRAIEVGAEVLLMGKNRADAVYDSDPNKSSSARPFDHLGYLDALNLRLEVMDTTAISLCMDNQLPIIVFDLFQPRSIGRILTGDRMGTMISGDVGSLLSEKV